MAFINTTSRFGNISLPNMAAFYFPIWQILHVILSSHFWNTSLFYKTTFIYTVLGHSYESFLVHQLMIQAVAPSHIRHTKAALSPNRKLQKV